MDKTDIKYIIELLNEANQDRDWDKILEAIEFLSEYLDDDESDELS